MPRIVLMPLILAVGGHQRRRAGHDHRAVGGTRDARGGHGGGQDRRQQPADGGALVRGQPVSVVQIGGHACDGARSSPRVCGWACPEDLLGLFIGELFTGTNGIGYIITLAQKTFNSAQVYAMLLVFLLFCVAMVSVTQFAREKGHGVAQGSRTELTAGLNSRALRPLHRSCHLEHSSMEVCSEEERNAYVAVLAAVTGLALTGCAGSGDEQGGREKEKFTQVRMSYDNDDFMNQMTWMVADEKYWPELGFTEPAEVTASDEYMAALIGGDVWVAQGESDAIWAAMAEGSVPLTIVGVIKDKEAWWLGIAQGCRPE